MLLFAVALSLFFTSFGDDLLASWFKRCENTVRYWPRYKYMYGPGGGGVTPYILYGTDVPLE